VAPVPIAASRAWRQVTHRRAPTLEGGFGMSTFRRTLRVLFALLLLSFGAGSTLAQEGTPGASPVPFPPPSANVSVFAEGLDNPRGLIFGPDGALYVAEGGQGGTNATDASQCEQVVPPVGPYTGGPTARISKLDASGTRTTVAEGLPSDQTSPNLGSLVAGVSDIAFVGDTMYALISGGGCSHGNPDHPNGIIRVNADGSTELVADLSAFVKANPVAEPNPLDFEPDEGAYGLEALDGQLYVSESNHGAIDRVDPATGEITRVIDMSATEGHVVPTALAVGPDGTLYVSNLLTFPAVEGGAKVWTLTPDGTLTEFATGLTAVLGLAFDSEGRLYALETTAGGTADAPIIPGTGRVVRLASDGSWETIATGLVFPSGMTFGDDGTLYVSNFGFGFPPGAGQVVKVDVSMPPTS
jgi:sugar lactone lactonase YvrE